MGHYHIRFREISEAQFQAFQIDLVLVDPMDLLSSSSDTARGSSSHLSLLLLEVQRSVEVSSSLVLLVRMSMVLLHLTTLLLWALLSFRSVSAWQGPWCRLCTRGSRLEWLWWWWIQLCPSSIQTWPSLWWCTSVVTLGCPLILQYQSL